MNGRTVYATVTENIGNMLEYLKIATLTFPFNPGNVLFIGINALGHFE